MTAYPLDNVVTASQGSPGPFSGSWPIILTDLTSALGTLLNPLFVSGVVTVGSIGSVNVIQGTSPWQVTGSVGITSSVTVNQGTNPWVVSSSLVNNVTGTVVLGVSPIVNQGTAGSSAWLVSSSQTLTMQGAVGGQAISVSGTVTTNQGTNPWIISGSYVQGVTGSVGISAPVTVNQGTNPWVVSSSQTLTVQGAVGGQAVSVSGTVIVNQGTNPWVVSSSLIQNVTGTVVLGVSPTVNQGTNPWIVSSSLLSNVTGTVAVTGPVSVTQGTSPWAVSGTNTLNIQGVVGGTVVPVSMSQTIGVSGTNTLNVQGVVGGTAVPVSSSQTFTVQGAVGGQAVSVSGTVTVTQGTSPWVISGSYIQGITGSVALSQPATVNQGTNPWVVSSSQTFTIQGAVGGQAVSISGTATVNQGTNPWVVSSSLVQNVTGTVILGVNPTVLQGTNPWIVSSSHIQNVTGTVAVVGPVTVIQGGSGSSLWQMTSPSLGATGSSAPGFATLIGGPNISGSMTALAINSGSITVVGSGSLGTPAGGVMTIQGAAGMSPLSISGTINVQGVVGGGSLSVSQGTNGSVSFPWFFQYSDQTRVLNLKAPSAGVADTDASLPVGLSPNSPARIMGNTFSLGTGLPSGSQHVDVFASGSAAANTCNALMVQIDQHAFTRIGMMFYDSGRLQITQLPHSASNGFFWLVNPTGSLNAVAVRKIAVQTVATGTLANQVASRVTFERLSFTSFPTGPTISGAKRDTQDWTFSSRTQFASLRTTNAGMTITTGSVIDSFMMPPILTGVGVYNPGRFFVYNSQTHDDYLVLRPGEAMVCRQLESGSNNDSRSFSVSLEIEEYA